MDTEEESVVAEEPSSEPTAKNYSLREELTQNRGILRSPCGRFEQSDTGENCCVEMAEREGFEPPIGLHLCRISSAVHSTTLPPLQAPIEGDSPLAVGPCSRRGWRARQGAGGIKCGAGPRKNGSAINGASQRSGQRRRVPRGAGGSR